MNKERIDEFILALNEEIAVLKHGNGKNAHVVSNGCYMRKTSDFFVYTFYLESSLFKMDEAPAEIEINGQIYEAHVLASQGQEIEIGVTVELPKKIPEAMLRINTWFVWEQLKKKYEKYLRKEDDHDFTLSEAVFTGEDEIISSMLPQYSPSKNPPNDAQKKAIEASFSHKISVIWGPPGTGKTKTIAMAIEAHLRAGRRVLLVSHANNAVDEALESVAIHLKATSFYQEGKMIRIGVPQEKLMQRLEQKCPLVFPEKIVEHLGSALFKEKIKIQKEKEQIENDIQKLNMVIGQYHEYQESAQHIATINTSLAEYHQNYQKEIKSYNALIHEKDVLCAKLRDAHSAGTIKRIIFGLSPQKLQETLSDIENRVYIQKGLIREIDVESKRLHNIVVARVTQQEKLQKMLKENLNRIKIHIHDISVRKESYEAKIKHITIRIGAIDKELGEIEGSIVKNAKFIATTLTKTHFARQLSDVLFDVMILDEASMAPLPSVYWALGHCTLAATIVGDFMQLPPIALSPGKYAKKWLRRSIFSILNITTIEHATIDPRVSLLNIQYRMAPGISCIPRELFYKNLIDDGRKKEDFYYNDSISTAPLVLLDTSIVNPWCSKIKGGGRFNVYNALLCVTLAQKILHNDPHCSIGIVTPYNAQAKLIGKIAKDDGLLEHVHISTIHRFQGGQEQVIIFDSVEGPVEKIAPMLDEMRGYDSDAPLLLNVAITRAQNRFYFIGHIEYLNKQLTMGCVLEKIVQYMEREAQIIIADTIVTSHFATDFEKYIDVLSQEQLPMKIESESSIYNEQNFWPNFLYDVTQAKKRIIIYSPFITAVRTKYFIDRFYILKNNGVDITIYTSTPNNMSDPEKIENVITYLKKMGITVIVRPHMHEKIIIIDDEIVWEGSLNVLSHRDTHEHMRRIVSKNAVNELLYSLRE